MAPAIAGAPLAQLPPVFRRATGFAGRHLDDTGRDGVARVPPDAFGISARLDGFRRPGADLLSDSARRRVGRPLEPAPDPDRHADPFDAAILRAGSADAERPHHHLGAD